MDKQGKVGVSIKRKITDENYGSYEFAFWAEEEYIGDDNRNQTRAKLLAEIENQMVQKIGPILQRNRNAKLQG